MYTYRYISIENASANQVWLSKARHIAGAVFAPWTTHIRVVNPITFIIDTINKLMGLYEVCLQLITKITSTVRN